MQHVRGAIGLVHRANELDRRIHINQRIFLTSYWERRRALIVLGMPTRRRIR